VSSDVVVDIHNVTKKFGDRTVFSDVSLQVHRSEVVAIIGPSGAGKSTLIRCVNHLNSFEHGTITVLGEEVHGTEDHKSRPSRQTLRRIRTKTGMVFQTFNLFPHLSVTENVTLAPMKVLGLPKDQARERAERLLAMVGLSHRASAYPRRLSGGEQQRVAICRALAMEPEIMLFDEPTSMLDPELVGDVLDAIRRLAQEGMTMILVTHEMMFARDVADTVLVMADGGIAEMGAARDVLSRPRTERVRVFLDRVLRHTASDVESPGTASSITPVGGSTG